MRKEIQTDLLKLAPLTIAAARPYFSANLFQPKGGEARVNETRLRHCS